MNRFWHRIRRVLLHIRLQPIRVFVFHQVSDEFDESTMWKCDWTSTQVFKGTLLNLKESYTFISLADASQRIAEDRIRFRKYAVLTSDDGWASLNNIIPWLHDEHIPVTLFLNPSYLDGIHYQERESEKLLTENDIHRLILQYGSILSVASHGWTHADCTKMSFDEFKQSVLRSEKTLIQYAEKVSYYAFTYGHHTNNELDFLHSAGLVPVLVDGQKNINDKEIIHRECIDGGLSLY